MTTPTTTSTATDLQHELRTLLLERELAAVEGIDGNATYMADLEQDIAAHRAAYVGAAVTEIASLRAEMSGRLDG